MLKYKHQRDAPKIILNFRPNVPRRIRRHLKKPLDSAETGLSRPDWGRMMMIMVMIMTMIMTTTTTPTTTTTTMNKKKKK
jgi:hypothetical protein